MGIFSSFSLDVFVLVLIMYQIRLRLLFKNIGLLLLLLVSLLMLARLVMFYRFTNDSILLDYSQDVYRMWWFGLRYDLRAIAIVISPLMLVGLLSAASQIWWQRAMKLMQIYVALISFFVTLLAIVNYFYYQTFHLHFDIFMFGLVEDDTKAVLTNMWDDYPVVRIMATSLLSALVITGVWYKKSNIRLILNDKVPSSNKGKTYWKTNFFIAYLIVYVVIIILLARGSLGTFPLRRSNAQVSEAVVINQLTPNALMALNWAWKDKKEDVRFEPVTWQEGERLLAQLGFDRIDDTTPQNMFLMQHSPHVVVTLMESFGTNMLAFDDERTNDLLGEFRVHTQQDFWFKRFVSHGNGTAPSLAGLFFNSPVQNISHSSAKNIVLETPFSVYKNANYRTIFISPGNMMWRNLVNYLSVQGVDEVYDQNSLMARYPESAKYMTDWGLPDEYAFKLAKELLEQAKEPLFISILTVTNHPPYVTPDNYDPKPIKATAEFMQHAEDGLIEQETILMTFQYAANAFGEFVHSIKTSSLADNTIMAATGDHQMRRIRAFYPEEMMLDRAVPFYLYVPNTILGKVDFYYDPERIGSHKDIMPTLYHFSLSNQSYLALGGRNMLAITDNSAKAFGYNELIWINDKGAATQAGDLWAWDDKSLRLKNTNKLESPTKENQNKHELYNKLLRWNLNRQVAGVE